MNIIRNIAINYTFNNFISKNERKKRREFNGKQK